MLINEKRAVYIDGDKAKINKPIYLYRGDGNVSITIEIYERNAFRTLHKVNPISYYGAMSAKVCVVKPDGIKAHSEPQPITEDNIKFVITDDLISEIKLK